MQPHGKNNNINQPNLPKLPETKMPTNEHTWRDPWLQVHMQQRITLSGINGRRGLWSSEGSFSQCRENAEVGEGGWEREHLHGGNGWERNGIGEKG